MKNTKINFIMCVTIAIISASCSALKNKPAVYEIDPVCHMKVNKEVAYTYTYKDVEYYFDNINCRETFKMDPDGILKKNSCEVKK